MKRQLALLGFALGALDRRRARTIAVTVALTVVIAALASTVALTDALRAEARRGVDAMPDLTVSTLVAGRPGFVSVQNAVRVVSIEGVASVRARVWGYVFLDGLASNVAVVGIAPDDHGALPH